MATATQKTDSLRRLEDDPPSAASPPNGGSTEFLIYEDNGGRYHWAFAEGDGTMLVSSRGCASQADAEQAATRIREAFAAPFDVHGHSG
jgi:uncharacterized protein YegP (UPF0339 family)